ncbi:MAG TPA: FmdB family zinc ribbon protein [Gemmataceae bacterium]|jgi:putative FmdB family regulatory protein|nr:FmdB family zinc ribbon protein [Gemmataceae bacterium]
MPTYEYHCDACGNHFDEFQGINEPALKKCPKCKKQKLRRIFGAGAAIIFKGSGFYETDYRSDAYKASAKADKEKSSGDGGGDKKSTTDTTASTTESKSATTKNSPKSKTSKSDD